MPLWPRPGLRETLEWRTHVMVSEDGTEERTEVRTAPRQFFRMECFVPRGLQSRIVNLLYGARASQWWVPVWPQMQSVGAVTAGELSLTCETRYSEFRDDGMILLWQGPDRYQVLQMDTVASDTELTLTEETEAFEAALLMPLRRGVLTADPARTFDGSSSSLELSFQIEDNAELTVADPAQFLSADAYFEPGLLDGGRLVEDTVMRVDAFDPGLGVISYDSPWAAPRPARAHRMLADGVAEAWALREFLHRRRGRSVGFWQPSFENDLRVNDSGPITTALSVRRDGFTDYAAERVHIAVETAAGDWLPRTITSATPLGPDEVQLVLSSSLGVDAEDIRRISYMGFKRLDTDRVEITYTGALVAEAAVATLEIAP